MRKHFLRHAVEQRRQRDAGRDAALEFGEAESCVRRGDGYVAEACEHRPDAPGAPLDDPDDRLLAAPERFEQFEHRRGVFAHHLQRADVGARFGRLHVAAKAEIRARTAQHDHAARTAGVKRGGDGGSHGVGEAVACVRAGEGDRGDRTRGRAFDMLGHCAPPLLRTAAAAPAGST